MLFLQLRLAARRVWYLWSTGCSGFSNLLPLLALQPMQIEAWRFGLGVRRPSNQVKYGRRGLALVSIRRLTALEVSFVSGSSVSTTLAGCGSIVDESARPRIQGALLLESIFPAKAVATLASPRPLLLLRASLCLIHCPETASSQPRGAAARIALRNT